MDKNVILCVDNEQIVLNSLFSQIREEFADEYILEAALSVEEAFEVISEVEASGRVVIMIVSDWLVPDMKGDEFLIKVHQRYPSIIKILMMDQTDENVVSRARREADLHRCLYKPWVKADLVEAIESATNKKKQAIICVDDEQVVLNSLVSQIREVWGERYIIELASTGDEALDIYKDFIQEGTEVPVVIADYIMPGLKGDELLSKIHQLNPETKNILLTGQATLEGVINSVNLGGAFRIITKPWYKNDLMLTLDQAVKSFNQSIQLEKKTKALQELNVSLERKVNERTTTLRQTLDKLRESEEKYRLLNENAGLSICYFHPSGRIIFFNKIAASFVNSTPEELQGKRIEDIFPSAIAEEYYSRINLAVAAEGSVEFEDFVTQNDAKMWLIANAKKICHSNGDVLGVLIITSDITDRKHAEIENQRLVKELGEALENVKLLSGLLPICANCKRIRDNEDHWSQIEVYISKHSEADFSHGICPECAMVLYPDFFDNEK